MYVRTTRVFAGLLLLCGSLGSPTVAGSATLPDGRTIAPTGFTIPVEGFPSNGVLSPDGGYFAVVSQDGGAIDVLDTRESLLVERLKTPSATDLTWTTDGLFVTISLSNGLYSAPAVYSNPNGRTYVYLGLPNGVSAYTVTTTGGVTQLVPAWTASLSLGSEGTSPVVRDGVVYVAASNELVALDAATGAALATNASLGGVHWESPSIANGVIYCAGENHHLTAFAIVRST